MTTITITEDMVESAIKLVNEHGTRGAYARKANGYKCETHDPEAVSFCAVGALCRATGVRALADIEGALKSRCRTFSLC